MSDNPYQSPLVTPSFDPTAQLAGYPAAPKLGGFIMTMVIMDLVFCTLRLLAAAMSMIGATMLPANNPLLQSVPFEIATSLGVAVCGLTGNTLILLKKKLGVAISVGTVLFTVGSIGVGAWQAMLLCPAKLNTPEGVGHVIGVAFALIVRTILLVLYGIALRIAATKLGSSTSSYAR